MPRWLAWVDALLLGRTLIGRFHDNVLDGISLILLSASLIGQKLLRTPNLCHEPGTLLSTSPTNTAFSIYACTFVFKFGRNSDLYSTRFICVLLTL